MDCNLYRSHRDLSYLSYLSYLFLALLALSAITLSPVSGQTTPEVLSFCGDPGRPPRSQVSPIKSTYTEGESVTYTCNEFFFLEQNRKCVKGRWVGPPPVCGKAFKNNDVTHVLYRNLDTGSVTNEYHLAGKLKELKKFGNSFLAARYELPVRGEGAKNYRVELTLEHTAHVQIVRVSFSVVDHLFNEDLKEAKFNVTSVSAAHGQECSRIAQNSVVPWVYNSTRFDFWYVCRASDPDRKYQPDMDLTDRIVIETACNFEVKIDLATFMLAETYNNRGNRSDPICGLPEVPLGLESHGVIYQSQYSFSCAPNFRQISTSSGQFMTCGHDMNWHGELPKCLPIRICPLLKTEPNQTVEVFKYDRVFYGDNSSWLPVPGSQAFHRC